MNYCDRPYEKGEYTLLFIEENREREKTVFIHNPDFFILGIGNSR